MTNQYPIRRMRRLRSSPTLREMLAEVHLRREQLIAPLFVCEGEGVERPIASMPGQAQLSVDRAVSVAERLAEKGIRAVLLFGVVPADRKDEFGTAAWDDSAPVQRATTALKARHPDLLVITDTCLCEYTDHGHCGPLGEAPDHAREVDNEQALAGLAKAAVSQARCGADLVAPSAMMDGQVQRIRAALDGEDYHHVGILSYAVKFASALYGPFRDAAESPPQFGDRLGYQLDYRNPRQGRLEAALDQAEGADLLMVKPAVAYLDVIADIRSRSELPLVAYHVSGEYAMLKAAAEKGWLDERRAVLELTTGIVRAGADLVMTYYAEQICDWLS